MLGIVTDLLGPHPIIDNASIFATTPGVSYNLDWHRDVIQIPQDQIRDELFSPDWPHTSMQINLPLHEEQSLWVVPVKIPAGHALLYNNNLIHRGYKEGMQTPRRTLHMGYHSGSRKPTCHFYLLALEPISDPAYQARRCGPAR